ncbi:putative ribonuclease H-like domain-containing protein [Tanacetum coccineum]
MSTPPKRLTILLPLWTTDLPFSQGPKSSQDDGSKPSSDDGNKVDKVLRKDTLRAWYETLSTYLLDNGFERGKIDKTLFIIRHKGDILLVQVYVDDIIFGSTNKKLCIAFEKLMHEKFQMSSMGELTFFLGLQVQQKKDGIVISQDKYVGEILKKFGFTEVKTASTPMETQKPLATRLCACARYQVNLKVLHLYAVKRTCSSETTAWNEFSSTMASAIICLATNQKFNFSKYIFESMVKNLENVSGKFLMYPRFVQVFVNQQLEGMPSHKRIYVTPSHTKKIFRNMRRVGKGISGRETPLFQTMVVQHQEEMGEDNVADKAINEEMDDSLERVATTATSLDGDLGGGPTCQETIGDTFAQTRSENVSKLSNDLLLARVLALETTKTTQAMEITSLKRRVKKLERRNKSRTHRLKRLYKVGLSRRVESYDEEVHDLDGDEVIVDNEDVVTTAEETRRMVEEVTAVTIPVSVATTTTTITIITDVEMTLAQALVELNSAKPKADKDKGKGKMVKPEPVKKISKKELLRLDEELAFKLQVEEEEEERLAKEKSQQVEEANIAWDDVQAKIDVDYQLAQRLQAQEQDEFNNAEKARLPPTRAQQRSIMCTYLKNMEGWKPKSLKNKSFAYIQELFDKAVKKVNTFVDYRTELIEESSKKEEAEIAHESSLKRAREELEQESSKKQKLEEDKESEELKQCLEIFLDDRDDVTIDVNKSPTISIVKARFKKTEPVNYMDNFLLFSLKTMFEHHVEDNVWNNQQRLVKVLNWKLYDSCGVHCVTMQNMLFYLFVEKMYPLINHKLHQMFNDVKLQVYYEYEMAFELLRLVKKQLKEGYVPE